MGRVWLQPSTSLLVSVGKGVIRKATCGSSDSFSSFWIILTDLFAWPFLRGEWGFLVTWQKSLKCQWMFVIHIVACYHWRDSGMPCLKNTVLSAPMTLADVAVWWSLDISKRSRQLKNSLLLWDLFPLVAMRIHGARCRLSAPTVNTVQSEINIWWYVENLS